MHQWCGKEVEEEKCGIWSVGERLCQLGLLFGDDTCLVASDERSLKKSLQVLLDWCREWELRSMWQSLTSCMFEARR